MDEKLVEKVLLEGHNILSYWSQKVVLPDGSFYGEITHEGIVHKDAPRGVILAARILWTYSRAVTSGFAATAEHLDMAHRSYEFLRDHFWDINDLGFYWLVDAHGTPLNTRKHIYAQAFSIYALAEYYAASQNTEALRTAQLTYALIEKYAVDQEFNGYLESFTQSWSVDADLRLSPQDMNEAKSMNTHLHILEAYTRLFHVWPNEGLQNRIANLLDVCKKYILDRDSMHYLLFFDANWTPKSELISYGHDIEGSWLMLEAAEAIHDERLIHEFQQIAVEMVNKVLAEGVDEDYGIMNEGRDMTIVDDEKHWWPQAEAVVGCINAYQITGDAHYLEAASDIWGFIEKYMRDQMNGEWYWKLSRDRQPDASKPVVELWKCPYHNARACIEVWLRLSHAQEEQAS